LDFFDLVAVLGFVLCGLFLLCVPDFFSGLDWVLGAGVVC
jgi:hypothetical protein